MAAWASLSGYLYFKPGGGGKSVVLSALQTWRVRVGGGEEVGLQLSVQHPECRVEDKSSWL